MAQSLIQRLDAAFKLNQSPDAIVRLLGDPFPDWRLGNTLTPAEYEQHKNVEIVLLHRTRYSDPSRAEVNIHKISGTKNGAVWSLTRHWQSWLGDDYIFRSQSSYDANPDEPAPALGPSVDDDD